MNDACTDLELRDRLQALGYDAKLVFGGCFDIDQKAYYHYLSNKEARALLTASVQHPIDLHNYARRNGLNLWYTFPQEII